MRWWESCYSSHRKPVESKIPDVQKEWMWRPRHSVSPPKVFVIFSVGGNGCLSLISAYNGFTNVFFNSHLSLLVPVDCGKQLQVDSCTAMAARKLLKEVLMFGHVEISRDTSRDKKKCAEESGD